MLIFCDFMPAHTDSCRLSDEKTQKSFKSGLFSKSYNFLTHRNSIFVGDKGLEPLTSTV